MLAAIGRARHGLRQASIVNIHLWQHVLTVTHTNVWPFTVSAVDFTCKIRTVSPKTLTLVLLKALIRTNDNRGILFKLPFNGAGFAFGDELPLLLKAPIRNSAGLFFELLFTLQAKRVVCRSPRSATLWQCRSKSQCSSAKPYYAVLWITHANTHQWVPDLFSELAF